MSTSVKHITNSMRGAPQISGTPGTLIAALDAFFLTGWGATTAVSVSVSGGIATATLTSGETFDAHAVVLVGGGTPAAINGESRVLTTSLTSITWATTAPDGPVTGTVTIRYAPQTSWTKVYAGTNKAVYRSSDAQSSGHYLRVDDTGATFARVRGFETMADVDTGTGPFPTDALLSGGGYWWKSAVSNAVATPYRIFSDSMLVIFEASIGTPQNGAASIGYTARYFGDPIALAPGGDAWCTLLSVQGSALGNSAQGSFPNDFVSAAAGMTCAPRSYTGLGGAVLLDNKPETGSGASGRIATMGRCPSEIDGQVKTSRVFVRQTGTEPAPRAVIPGGYFIPQSFAYEQLANGDTLGGAGALAGRTLMVVQDTGDAGISSNGLGRHLIDMTGPWR